MFTGPSDSVTAICRRRRLVTSCVLCVCIVSGCDSDSRQPKTVDSPGQPEQATAESWPVDDRHADVFVGSQKCVECHQEIAESYLSSHPMALSVRFPEEFAAGVPQALPHEFSAGGKVYSVRMEDGKMVQTERMSDSEGEVFAQSCTVDFAIGSGTRGYTFVTAREGALYQDPITWYSQSQHWDLSPGYDPGDHPRFERQMSDGCVVCHAGRANRQPEARNRFEKPVFHEAIIGCERCHGAGGDHVAAHHSGAEIGVETIVNPGRLSPERRDSVCYQCHLHGRGRILRQSRSEYDFRPGDLLSDVWVAFVDTPTESESTDGFKAVSQVEQMIASRCYQASNGKFGCISCHDPHRKPSAAERVRFYRNRCLECHGDSDGCSLPVATRKQTSPEDSCIQCHMPAAGARDVPHTAQTDHRVLRRYLESSSDLAGEPDVFQRDRQRLPNDAVQRAFGLMLARNVKTQSQAAQAMDILGPFVDTTGLDEPVLSAVSWLLLYLGDMPAARLTGEKALELQPENESTLEALVVLEQSEKNYAKALTHAEALTGNRPFNSTYQARHAEVLMKLKRFVEAEKVCRTALSVNPMLHEARKMLIEALNETGNEEQASAQRQILERIQAVQREQTE